MVATALHAQTKEPSKGMGTAVTVPANYRGTPFDDAAYRAEQQGNAGDSPQSRIPLAPALVVWDGMTPAYGTGWVGKGESAASISLDDKDVDGKRFIHYHNMGNGQSSIFGWRWTKTQEKQVDLRQFDAISFAIRITGPDKMQELYFGITEYNPTPVSLRKYDPQFADGAWHKITIPLRDLKWSPYAPVSDMTEVRGCVFMTHLWENSNYEIYLDHITFDRKVPFPGQVIPGRVECAFFDLGGEGVAYHDTDAINTLSGILNQQKKHQRPIATPYHWNFRKDEGVDLSYTKDIADFNHVNTFEPPINQLYIGGTEDGEWCNYTVDVKKAGTYKIISLYGNDANTFTFSINNKPASVCKFPVATGSFHKWNKAEVGTITFTEVGPHLLTLHYNKGNNFAYFDFELVPDKK